MDKENAVLVGTATDELIRHHPSLKAPVFEAIKSTMSKIEDMGNVYVVPEDVQQWYKLLPVSDTRGDEDIEMDVSEIQKGGRGDESPIPLEHFENPGNDPNQSEDSSSRAHDNVMVSFIDVLGRVRKDNH